MKYKLSMLLAGLFSLVLLAGSNIYVSPTTLTFSGNGSQTVAVRMSGRKGMWTASTNVPWLSVSPASGTTNTTLTVTATVDGLAPGIYTGSVVVSTGTGRAGSTVTLTVAAPPPPPPPPPPPSGAICGDEGGTADCGPQASILCPSNAVYLPLGSDIPKALASAATGTSFCLQAGVHYPTAPVRPNAAQVLTGEYGAIVDGRDVVQTFDTGGTAVISGWNCSTYCDGVTIRNIVVRNSPTYACIGLFNRPNNWTIDHVEAYGCHFSGNIGSQSGALLTHVYFHDPTASADGNGCAIAGYQTNATTIRDSEFRGFLQHDCKFADSGNLILTHDWWHGTADGGATLWIDTSGYSADSPHTCHSITGNLIDGASQWPAVDIEAVHCAVIGGNTFRFANTASAGNLFLTVSSNITVSYNIFIAPSGNGVMIYYDGRPVDYPVAGNAISQNGFRFGSQLQQGGYGCSTLDSSGCAAYMQSNGNLFDNNNYTVPSLSGTYWQMNGSFVGWQGWQSLGQDRTSILTQ